MDIIALGQDQAVSALRSALIQYSAINEDLPDERDLVELYQTSVVVFRAANKQASAVARIPMVAHRKKADGTTEDLEPDHPLARLFLSRLAYQEMIRRSDITLSFWGSNLLHKQRELKGQVDTLRWVNPNLWRLDVGIYEGLRGFRVRDQFGLHERLVTPPNAVHMHLIDFNDDFSGVGPAEVAFRFAAADPELAQTLLSTFRNRAIPPLFFQPAKDAEFPQTEEGHENPAQRLVRVLRETVKGSKNAGRTIVDSFRWEMQKLSQDFDSFGTKEVDEAIIRRVAMAWDMPTSLLLSGDASYAGQETDRREWYQGAISARCDWYGMVFTEQVAAEFGEEYVIEPDYSEVPALKEDEATKTNVVTAQVGSTLISLYRAQEKLGEEPDENLKDIYLLGGQPVLGSELRKRAEYKEPAEFGLPDPTDPDKDPDDESEEKQKDEEEQFPPRADDKAKPQPPRPQETEDPNGRRGLAGFIPSRAWRELTNWQRLLEQGKGQGFVFRAIPADVGAYARLRLATGDDAATAIEAARAQYRALYPSGEAARGFDESAGLYREILYGLVEQAFDGVDPQTGQSSFPKTNFTRQGQQAIKIYFQAAYINGLRQSGVGRDMLEEEEQAELNLEISAERRYWGAMSKELYGRMLPLYNEMLTLQDDAAYAKQQGDDAESQELQKRALEALKQFQNMRDQFLNRIDLWVNKGLRRIFNLGKMAAEKNPNVRWKRNPAKDSCRSCIAADGQVHPLKTWKKYGIVPQGDNLECGGFECGCEWEKTADRAQGRINRIPITTAERGLTADSEVPVLAAAMRAELATDFGFAVSLANDQEMGALVTLVQSHLGMPIKDMEWTDPYDWHLSLCYAAGMHPMSVIAALAEDVAFLDMQPVGLHVSHLEAWDTPAGIALVGIVEADPVLLAIQSRLHALFVSRELPVSEFSEPDAYKPHVTLGYAPTGTDLKGLPAATANLLLDNVCLTTPEMTLLFWSVEHDHEDVPEEPAPILEFAEVTE